MTFETKQIFAHSPSEFEFSPGISWERPCRIRIDLHLKPISDESQNKFVFPLLIGNWIDALSKTSLEKQFETVFWRFLDLAKGPYFDSWLNEFVKWHKVLKEQLRNPDTMFQHPLRFIRRQQFVMVDLATVLKQTPEHMEMYLAIEERTYSSYCFLRIHSSLSHFVPGAKYFWYEKRLPDFLETADIIPWFIATVDRVPKKAKPSDLQPWLDRLLHYEPDLCYSPYTPNRSQTEKPKITLVFGPVNKVGYRYLYHLRRENISLIRKCDRLTIVGPIQYGFADGKELKLDWEFHLLTENQAAAKKIEQEMITGKKLHFGLDLDIVGMIARSSYTVHAINVPVEMIREICLVEGQSLELDSNPRDKHKLFHIVPKQNAVRNL